MSPTPLSNFWFHYPQRAQVPGAIELVQARERKAGGVADVVQPRGGFQQIGVSADAWTLLDRRDA